MRFIWTERSQRSFEDIEKSNGPIVRFVPADSYRLVSVLGSFGLFYYY